MEWFWEIFPRALGTWTESYITELFRIWKTKPYSNLVTLENHKHFTWNNIVDKNKYILKISKLIPRTHKKQKNYEKPRQPDSSKNYQFQAMDPGENE